MPGRFLNPSFMIIKTRNNRNVLLRKLTLNDVDGLFEYLQKLSPGTRKKFGPHLFDKQSIFDFYKNSEGNIAYGGFDCESSEMIAYFIVKTGYLPHDSARLQSYGLTLDDATDCTFAPSVADLWQGSGIGNSLFQYLLSELITTPIKRIILWGGVQCDNLHAVNYYKRNGFQILGQFIYNGENFDMAYDVIR
jgi:GNAT superfamily N-acetyltransferase